MSACWSARARDFFSVLLAVLVAATLGSIAAPARAASTSYSTPFSFAHGAEVSSGAIAALATFTNTTVANSPTLSLPQFDPSLGRLTKATITVTTTTATFVITPTGTVSLISGGTATRNLRYNLTAGATTGTGSNEVTGAGATLLTLLGAGGGDIGGAPLANATPFTAGTDLGRFTGSGNVTVNLVATDTLTVSTVLSLSNGAGVRGAGTYAGSASVAYDYVPWTLGGYVYNDLDHNGTRSPGEAGTGLVLYAKLLAGPTGPVLQTTPVDPVTGLYGFVLTRGSYRVLIDDNASTSDIVPLQPPTGWAATQANGLVSDVTVGAGTTGQDFGLIRATPVAGRMFIDNGAGAGTANNGVADGAEAGASGQVVQLLDGGGTVLDGATTAPDGSFRLYVPSTVANGATLRLLPVQDNGLLATGASVGTTGGSYARASRTLTYTYSTGVAATGIALGVVAAPSLTPLQQQFAAPGAVVFYRHQFVATTAGKVTFSTSRPVAPVVPWSEVLYVDTNGNGAIDAGEPVAAAAIDVVAGQTVSLILKVTVPKNAAPPQRLEIVLNASLALNNAAPALAYALQVSDVTTVLSPDGTSLVLTTMVSAASAAPGATLVYTLTFSNPGTSSVKSLVISDYTPPYTTFVSSTAPSLPSALTVVSTTTPVAGAGGALRWTFGGELPPGTSGSLTYAVAVAP